MSKEDTRQTKEDTMTQEDRRDFFAGLALNSIPESVWIDAMDDNDERDAAQTIAQAAYRVADAMLQERERGK